MFDLIIEGVKLLERVTFVVRVENVGQYCWPLISQNIKAISPEK